MRRKIDIFDVLDVRPEDDIDTIRAAWRKKAKQLHPDVAKDKERSGDALARINAAYDDLKDHRPFAERRKGNRRKTRRDRMIWTDAERDRVRGQRASAERARLAEKARRRAAEAAAARRQAQAEAAARKKEEAEIIARRTAEAEAHARQHAAEVLRRKATARAAAEAARAKAQRVLTRKERIMRSAAISAYSTARSALSF